MENARRVLSFSEACSFLKMKRSKVYMLTSTQKIPHRKIGNQLYFMEHELLAWLDDHRRGPNYPLTTVQSEL